MRPWLIPIQCLLLLAAVGFAAAQEDTDETVVDSGVEERVNVVLVEFKVLVTDKKGNPITDLRPEEVEVLEGGRSQKLAFVESWLTVESDSALALRDSVPATVYSPTGDTAAPEALAAVPPPKPVRRVIFIFDVKNSRIRVREEWRNAAIEWVKTEMTEGDMASVIILRNYAQWILQATSDRKAVQAALESMDLFTDTPNRSRRSEMTDLLTDLKTACVDTGGSPRGGSGSRDPTATTALGDEGTCAATIARPYIDQWGNETDETILALRQLTGQLAAIPGRKAVVLFSEGIIPDPAEVAVNAVLSIWGSGMINFRSMNSTLRRDAFREISNLHRVAAASEVVYFTLDSRPSSERGYSEELEMLTSQARGALGINPWGEMYEATRSTLSALSYATGGRPFYGPDDLEADVTTAAAAFYGVYSVGYYRSNPLNPGKLKVKIKRKGIKFRVPNDVNFRKNEARKTPVEMAVGRPRFAGYGNLQQLPVAVLALYDVLPLRRGAGGRGCQLGVFLQAQRRDGTVAAERFDTTIIVVKKEDLEDLEGQYYDHKTGLELEPGQYRLRARLSDDFNEIVGDKYIDLTVGEERIAPGFVEISPPPGQEVGQQAPSSD
jgi:VWFA-related protein